MELILTLKEECFVLPPRLMWGLTIHTAFGPSVLAGTRFLLQLTWNPSIHSPLRLHRPLSSSDTICNDVGSPLVDIVLFWASLQGFKTCLLRRGFHILINNALFSSPTDVGSHNHICIRFKRFLV